MELLDYGYDAVNNIDAYSDNDGAYSYGYDDLDRLTNADYPASTTLSDEVFDYDGVGNREINATPNLWQYNANNQLTQGPDYTYSYDDDGNTQSRTVLASPQDPSAINVTYTHDLINRLTQFSTTATTANYQYEPGGRRISKDVDGTLTYFLWDGAQLVGEYDNAGIRTKRYGYLPQSFAPSQMEDANGVYTVHSDHLDTPKFLANSSEVIVWRSYREAFGEMVVDENPDGDANSVVMNLRFPGQYFDQESKTHYNYFRGYDPALGRYLQHDPIGLAGGVNVYTYAYENPLYWTDPLGLAPAWVGPAAAVAGASAGYAFYLGQPGLGLALAGASAGLTLWDVATSPKDQLDKTKKDIDEMQDKVDERNKDIDELFPDDKDKKKDKDC